MKILALLALCFAVAAPARVAASAATYTAGSANPAASFSTAADFNTVAVSMSDPGTPLRGSVTLSATAASDRGIASVTYQVAPAGSQAWTTACVATTAPYSCSWDTTAVADGSKDLRAVALDDAGYSRTSVVSARYVDNTAPATSLGDPGTPLHGTVSLGGSATDAGTGVTRVALQYRPSGGGSWTTICSSASCSWSTSGVPDGLYDLRISATDGAGNTGTTVVASRRVDNTAPTVTLTDPGAALGGSVTLSSTAADSGAGVSSVRYEYRTSPSGSWTTACTASSAPFSCSWSTTGVADGSYDLRATATDAAGNATTSAVVSARTVDNGAPTGVTLTNPGTPLQGTVTLSGGASDAGSGVASVRFQYAPAGTSSWTDACVATTPSYSCSWNTTGASDALYDMRALATDRAGNTTASATVTSRRVDNNGPTVTLADPGQYLHGTVTISATASDPAGVQSVEFDYRTSPSGTWTTICTAATAPYTCSVATNGVSDGSYDLRALATDTVGHTSTSLVTARTIDNTAPRGTDVQGANGGVAGRVDAGDTLTFTYSEPIAPATIMSGWNGSATAVTVNFTKSGSKYGLSVWDAAGTTRLGLTSSTQDLQPGQNWVSANTSFNATMAQSGSTVVVTFGSKRSGTIATGVSGTNAMTWTPSTAATDLAGNPCASTAVTESGPADVDF